MQLSIQQTQELLKIIDKNQLQIIGKELGENFFTEIDRIILRSYGIDVDTLYKPELSSIQTSFHFGMLSEALGQIQAKNVSYKEIHEYVKEGKYIPVSPRQQATLDSVKMQTFSSLKSLNGKIFEDVNNILIDKTRLGQQEFLAKELKGGLSNKKTVSQIAHAIAEKTGDWNRNFGRIIETASQTAFEEGKAAEIQRQNPGEDPDCYKTVFDKACGACIKAYLTGGIGSEPKIFKLSELRANGTNVGRKKEDWLPVIGAHHPFCRCSLAYRSSGYLWNPEKRSYSTPDPDFLKQVAKTRPLIKVSIGGVIKYL